MRGDFSRIRLSKDKGYTSVLDQQGRVAIDADANEQRFLDERRRRAETVDVIGQFGGPVGDDGFAIDGSSGEITIGAGRYYVAGLLCENPQPLSYDSQPYLRVPPGTGAGLLTALLDGGGQQVIQVYLQVWQRLVTGLDDPCLLEPALGGADTTARVQTVWRVMARSEQLSPAANQPSFCSALQLSEPATSTGTLTVSTGGPTADCGCGPVASAGYHGLENQLYRVEIQQGGTETTATFKWSRENGSVVVAVTGVSGATVQVDSLGPDANLGFSVGDWVELTDDTCTFGPAPNAPGALYEVQAVHHDSQSVTVAPAVTGIDPGQHARMRRWDHAGPSASANGVPLPVTPAVIELENGIQVSFGPGSYQAGDYWTIPARAETGTIEWPPCDSAGGNASGSTAVPPCSVEVYEAPLAVLYRHGRIVPDAVATDGTVTGDMRIHLPFGGPGGPGGPGGSMWYVATEDCRTTFRPLTASTAPATPQAIHVQGISWANDDVMTLDTLVASPLTVTLDRPVAGPVSGGNFIVTIEPFSDQIPSSDFVSTGIVRSLDAVDVGVTPSGQALSWTLPPNVAKSDLQSFISLWAHQGQFARARVRLPGYAHFTAGPTGLIYLDGRALGQPGSRTDGTARVDLRFPSGDGSVTSDFESWFYLAPAQGVASVGVTPSDLTVILDSNGAFAGVEQTGLQGAVTPSGTVWLSYQARSPVTVALSMINASGGLAGVNTIATVPATVTVPAGATSVNFTPTFGAGPPWNTTTGFQLTASVSTAVSGWTIGTYSTFDVTMPAQPAPPQKTIP